MIGAGTKAGCIRSFVLCNERPAGSRLMCPGYDFFCQWFVSFSELSVFVLVIKCSFSKITVLITFV